MLTTYRYRIRNSLRMALLNRFDLRYKLVALLLTLSFTFAADSLAQHTADEGTASNVGQQASPLS